MRKREREKEKMRKEKCERKRECMTRREREKMRREKCQRKRGTERKLTGDSEKEQEKSIDRLTNT